MEIAIMIEGQNGLNWGRWQNIARAVEDLGFAGLYRSDHFSNAQPPDLDSLELWVSLTWLASHTKRLEFGPLVSPLSFRHPVMTARMASAVDDLSGGRLTLGLGAGWQEREHHTYGFELLSMKERFDRFEEGLEIITRLMKSEKPVQFNGHYYRIDQGILLPRPARRGGCRILIGGNGEKRTLPLVARFADEWNAIFSQPSEFQRLSEELDQCCIQAGRDPKQVKRSMMTGLRFGQTKRDLDKKLRVRNQTVEELVRRGFVVGVGEEIMPQLVGLKKAGVQRLMLQWLELDDLKGLTSLAKTIGDPANI